MSPKMTRFESLLEAVPDALVGMDQKGIIRFVNRQTESLFGYDRDDVVGQRIEKLLPEPLWQIYSEHKETYFADLRTRSSGLDVVLRGKHRDGTKFPVNISLSHIDTGDVLLVVTAVRDVASQREAVETARVTAAVVEYSNDAIFGGTLDGTITSWNPAAERMYGYSREEIIGRSGGLLLPDDRAGEMDTVLGRIREGEAVEHFETMRVRKDGTVFPVSLTVAPIRDEDGVIVGASAVHRDVTQQRLAFELAQRMAAMVEFSGEAIIGATLEGVITSWNPAAEILFGYASEEMIGKSGSLVQPADRAAEADAILARIRVGQNVENIDSVRVRKDGTTFPVVLSVSAIHDPDGAVVAVDTIVRDVTSERQAFEVAQRIAAIVESSDDAIMGRSLDGKVTDWNPAAERMYGYSSEDIVGRSVDLVIPKDLSEEMEAVVTRVVAGQPVERLETIRIRKDGTLFPVSLTVSPIRGPDGAIVGVSVIGRDMTEKERAARYARCLIEADLDPLVTISPEGKIKDVNEATVQVTGVARDELLGSDFWQYVTEPDKAHEIFEQVFMQESITDFPLTVRHRDGTLTDVRCNASVYRDLGGEVLGVFATGRDVTEQRQAFEAAQRIAAIVEGSDDAIIGRTLDGNVTSWNPAAERMFGYTSEEIMGRSVGLLIPEDRTAEMTAILSGVIAGRPVEHLETVRTRKDGTVFPISLTVSPIRGPDGAIAGASVICRDLTEQEQAAQYARSLIEAGLDPLVTISPEGKIKDVNEATVTLTGVSRKKLIGTDFSRYFTDPDMANELHGRAFASGSVSEFPLTVRHRDGSMADVLCNASVYRDSGGHVLGVLTVAHDMTKHKEAS